MQPIVLIGSIVAGVLLGQLVPGVRGVASASVSGAVFVLITASLLGVEFHDLGRIVRSRRFLLAAVVLNFVVNPLFAWGLGAVLLDGHPGLRVGLLLFLLTPCIGWYLVFTELAGGDTELGVGILGVNIALQIMLLPLYLSVFVDSAAAPPVATVVRSVLLFLVVPGVVAWALRSAAPAVLVGGGGELLRSVVQQGALVVVIVAMFASQSAVIVEQFDVVWRLVPPMLAFFLGAFVLAVAVADRLALPQGEGVLLAFTTTSRNSEASLAIAATAFADPLVALTVALGPAVELPLLVLMVRYLRRRRR